MPPIRSSRIRGELPFVLAQRALERFLEAPPALFHLLPLELDRVDQDRVGVLVAKVELFIFTTVLAAEPPGRDLVGITKVGERHRVDLRRSFASSIVRTVLQGPLDDEALSGAAP
jgi:hypothetical protein